MMEEPDQSWTNLDTNIIVMCLIISYAIGANNAGNSWSTSYSTRSLYLSKAVKDNFDICQLWIGFFFEILGAALMTHNVEGVMRSIFEYQVTPGESHMYYFFGISSAEVRVRKAVCS